MQNNRDSSILRSLAVAFGDGVAFGVGMKLTQSGRGAPAPSPEIAPQIAPAADLTPLLERLDAIEGRIGEVERVGKVQRAALAPAFAAAPAPFDQKVLEAIVKALDARLLEQAGQVERRITELEARFAIDLKTLDQRVAQRITQQDHSVMSGVQTHIEEWNGQFNDQLAAMRRQSDEERAAIQREIASLRRECVMEAALAVEERTAELRTEIQSRDSQIVALRAQLAAGDQKLHNVALAIGQACQTVLGSAVAPAKAEPERVVVSERAPECAPERMAEPSPELPLPGFAQPRLAARAMPVALVSWLALSAAGFAMLHYL
ncbi:MAG: hypothetical protein ABSG03_34280 [Bryobacteraceae bacterium]|jgi:hypothetical protein